MTESDSEATWTASEWLGRTLIDRDGERIGKLQDVYVDVETDEPQFATVKEGSSTATSPSSPWPASRSAPTNCA